jgi:hypothetical protein
MIVAIPAVEIAPVERFQGSIWNFERPGGLIHPWNVVRRGRIDDSAALCMTGIEGRLATCFEPFGRVSHGERSRQEE